MLKIFPFRGWRYNPEKIRDFSTVVAPPYDVIDPKLQKELRERSPYNVVRVDLPEGAGERDKYQEAGKIWESWKKEGVLIQDSSPCIYLYFQTFTLPDGKKVTRKGFFARRRLETFGSGGVKPHERTFSGPKEDRFQLTKATHCNLSPVFGIYGDPQNLVGPQLEAYSREDPDLRIRNGSGEEQSFWVVRDSKKIEKLLEGIQERPVLIADGHHRYETALNYLQFRKAAAGHAYTGEEDFHYVLMYFCSVQDPGLVVLPTHRVLSERPDVDLHIVRDLLENYATLKEFSFADYPQALDYLQEEGKHEQVLGWVHDGKVDVLTFDRDRTLESGSLNHLHFALRDLDVTVLHDLVLEEVMGLAKGAQREYGTIQYLKDPDEVLKTVQEKNTFGFLMNPTKIPQIEAVCEIGETMPQKSTFFYPKLKTGLVFHDLG